MRPVPEMLMNANGCRLKIESPHGDILDLPFEMAVLAAKINEGEVLKGVVDVFDEDTGTYTRYSFNLRMDVM
jgi:hypothetical protein